MDESRRPKWKTILLTAVDHSILALIIAPLTVMYWWATWSLMDYYLYPGNKLAQGSVAFLVGLNGMTFCYCAQDPFTHFSQKYNKCFVWLIFNHVYTAIFAFSNVCHWLGVWYLCDLLIDLLIGYWGDQLTWTIIFLSTTILTMMFMRQLVNVRAPPVVIAIDADPNIYKITTRFNRSWKEHGCWFILDCAFTVIIVHSLVVLFWRNSWVMWDLQMARFKLELATDGAICLIIAYLLLLLVYVMQIPVRKLIRAVGNTKDHWVYRVLIEQLLLHLWAGEAAVAVWRGCWLSYANNIKIPNSPVGGLWLGSLLGMGLLMFFLAGTSIIARGGDVDGASEDGSGAILLTKYFRFFIERRQTKKLRKEVMVEMEELSKKKEKEEIVENGGVDEKLLEEKPEDV